MAELSEYIAPIIAPDLGSPEFSTSLVEAFNTIDSNFKKIIQAPYLKGDRGTSIETVVLKKPDHVVEGNPSEYEALLDAIIRRLNSVYYPGCDPTTQGVCHDALPDAGVNSADKLVQEDHFTVFKDFSTNEMYLICPYIFIDARIQYLDRITESNRQKFIDTSSIVTGKYTRNNEGVYRWTIDISTNIPKLYFDDQSGYYCWLVNNEKTGIIAQGVKGKNGIDGNITICRGIRATNTIEDANTNESRIVIKGVYQQQSSNESNSQSIPSTVYGWVPVGSNTSDLENRPVLVYGYDSESDYNNSPKYIQFGIAFVEDIAEDTTEDAEGTSTPNASKQYYIVYVSNLDLVKIIRENSIAKLLETISSSGSVQGLYISSEKNGNTIQNVHMFWNDSDNKAHLSKVPYSCTTHGVQGDARIRGSKLYVDYDTTIVNGDITVQGDSTVSGDSTVGGDIKLQSTQGVQGKIGLQGIQHTTGDVGECELALVPSFNVSIKTEHDISTTISGVQRLDKTILRVQTPWIGYIRSSSSISDGIRTDNHSLYEACQLVDESGSNEYIIDITQQNNSTSRVPFWTRIPNHELGISSMFATDNEDIYVHVFQQEKTLYGSIIRNYVNNTYSKYYLNFLVQVVLIKNPTNRVYATIIYKLLNTYPNISVHTSAEEYQSLYIALTTSLDPGNPNLYSEYIGDTYFATADTLYFDVIQRLTGTPRSTPISLDVVKCNTLSNNMNKHNTNMFTWVESNDPTISIADTAYNIILGYTTILSRIGVTTIDNPIYSKIKDTPTKLSIRQQSYAPVISDYVSFISMRSSKFRKCSMQLRTMQGSGSNSVCSLMTIYPQSGVFMNDLRLYTLHDVIDYKVDVFQTSRNNSRSISCRVLTSTNNPITISTQNLDSETIRSGFQGAQYSTEEMILSTHSASYYPILDIYNDNSITVQGKDIVIRQAYIYTDSTLGSLGSGGLRGVQYTNIGSPYRVQYSTQGSSIQDIQGIQECVLQDAKINISTIEDHGYLQFICLFNKQLQHVAEPYIRGNIKIINNADSDIDVYTRINMVTYYRVEQHTISSHSSKVINNYRFNQPHYIEGISNPLNAYEFNNENPSLDTLSAYTSPIFICAANSSDSIQVQIVDNEAGYSKDVDYIKRKQLHRIYSLQGEQTIGGRINHENQNTDPITVSNPTIVIPQALDYFRTKRFRVCDTRWGLDESRNGLCIRVTSTSSTSSETGNA